MVKMDQLRELEVGSVNGKLTGKIAVEIYPGTQKLFLGNAQHRTGKQDVR